jgi:hypothetical protein
MGVLESILKELDELYIVQHVSLKHDEARAQRPRKIIVVENDAEFDDVIAEYYNHHFTRCISGGGSLSRAEAAGRAKQIIEQYYRRHGGDILDAYRNGKKGTDGGIPKILDIIFEHLKEEAIEYHVRDVFDRYVAPSSWEEQVAIIKELLIILKNTGATSLDFDHPERYAKNYEELIRAFSEGLQRSAARLRRL